MNIQEIDRMIDELKTSETSLSNIRNLSALYVVKDNLTKGNDVVTDELKDILPSYVKYIEVKRRYQLKEISEESVYINMKQLCREIKEFIQTLYSCTDTPRERDIIKQMLEEIL